MEGLSARSRGLRRSLALSVRVYTPYEWALLNECDPGDPGDGLDPRETGGPGCRPAASGGVQLLAENNILAYCQTRETSGG